MISNNWVFSIKGIDGGVSMLSRCSGSKSDYIGWEFVPLLGS